MLALQPGTSVHGFIGGRTGSDWTAPARGPSLAAPVAEHPSLRASQSQTPLTGALFKGNKLWQQSRVNQRKNGHTARQGIRAVAQDVEFDLQGESVADDYYSILGVRPDSTQEEIKRAYYGCMKVCHPDLSGNHPESVAFCQFINEVYEVLSDPGMRAVYDEINGYSASGVNPFTDTRAERDHAFVDEFSCIGCKNCANTAERTFEMEDLFGRARVMCQSGDSAEKVQEAIDTCPVNCIHWVTAAQLSLLEDEMRRMERVSVGMMAAGMGSKGADVFAQAHRRWQKRQSKALETARLRMMKEKGRKHTRWSDMWQAAAETEETADGGGAAAGRASQPYDASKMARAASAARRWREYSRRGVDRRARRVIEAVSEMQKQEEETAG